MSSCEDKDLLKYIDSVIAGKEPEGEIDADTRAVLDFAHKMISLKEAPSPEYQNQLKVRLVHKLAEQQKKEQTPWLSRILRQPAWVVSISAFVLVLITVVIMASATDLFKRIGPNYSGVITTATVTTAATATTQPSPSGMMMAAAASTDKTEYAAGQDIQIKISLRNDTANSLKIDDFPPIVSVLNADTGLAVYTFERKITGLVISPLTTASYSLTWNQKTAAGTPAGPGNYYIELEDINYNGNAVKLTLTTPARFTIGVGSSTENMTLKNVIVNVSQSDKGVIMTLQKLEIMKNGFKIYATAPRPQNYTEQYPITADYSIDKGWYDNAGNATVIIDGNNVLFIWNVAAVIPQETDEIIINMEAFWETGYSWQFTVPLK
jgi:hypothetical protein